ncbi:MAG: hypothetical protein JSS61_01565 [Verrucomicrobia bacterium]|nr:hypothetical protein [Verrucomicrobiota bacterium]
MRIFPLYLLLLALLAPLDAKKMEKQSPASGATLKPLYSSLDPLSVTENLAFYELYPSSEEGKLALNQAWKLLGAQSVAEKADPIHLPTFDIQAIISLVTRQPFEAKVELSKEQLHLVNTIASPLHNRQKKGHTVWTKEEVLALPSEEIDLARGLLIFQFDEAENPRHEIEQYEASLDLMALQIAARLPENASDEEKIRAINRFIFQEMQFRFPPHSLYANDIDLYTFLPSVLDGRRGVCLGVSILYLCLAERLDLPLEIITPPGHIYVRYHEGDQIINIETTARGIDPPSELYLGINTRKLHERTKKEVIGLAFMNQASVFWAKEDYAKTVALYEKALPFLTEDPLLKMLLSFNYLFVGKTQEALKLMRPLRDLTFDEAVSPETIPADYLSGKINAEGIKAVFLSVDETRASILKKQKEIQQILQKYPQFRAGLLHLATTYLQLGRASEALEVLERHHAIDPHHAIVEYYLSVLSIERLDYNRAWSYLSQTESLLKARGHTPRALLGIRDALRRMSPDPS